MLLQNLQLELTEYLLADEMQTDLFMPAENINIYRQQIYANLLKTLQDIYPLIGRLIGADVFALVAKDYIAQYPSRSGNLNDYGTYFSHFIAASSHLKNLKYLPEIALFEWACHVLEQAADHAAYTGKSVEHISEDEYAELYFTLHPACDLFKFNYPILQIINSCLEDKSITLDSNACGVNLLLMRQDLEMTLMTLTETEFAFLKAIESGQALADSLIIALSVDTQFNFKKKLTEWIEKSIIVDAYLSRK